MQGEFNLQKVVDSYIKENSNDTPPEDFKFRVSDSGRCHLFRFWKRQRRPFSNPYPENNRRTMQIGNMIHSFFQDVLEASNVLEHKEFLLEDEHRIGHVDMIVRINDKRILYELKTANSRAFQYVSKDNNILHSMQAYTYSLMLPFRVDDVRIAYISKEDMEIKEFSVLNINDIASKVNQDWKILIDAWEKQKEPAPNPQGWECRYCVYLSDCKYDNKR
ncbi:MAG: Dna2/Cas4 domain-containing protein [Candidatus Aenigmatarchaeota archaeon]